MSHVTGAPRQTGYGEHVRKNHYGSRSERGTRVAALCYTLLETAKLAKVEPVNSRVDCAIHSH